MDRSLHLAATAALATLPLAAQAPPARGAAGPASTQPPFSVVEATIPQMRQAMEQGRVTSRELVLQSLERIATYEETLNAVLAVNPGALAEADARDRERREGKVRGPLHGIPIAVKDNIHTTDMPTTGGALAFEGFVPPYEATLTRNLRETGAVIIAKTVMTELGATAPVRSLTGLRLWNLEHTRAGSLRYGQSNLDISDEMDLVADRSHYEMDRAKDLELAGSNGIEAVLKAHDLDALLFPGGSGASIAARPGYPTVIVPIGFVPNAPQASPFPAGFEARPSPYGASFTGLGCSEPRLIEIAYAFEQATKRRVPPQLGR
jgi:Asp-tRNA(Asn)/Glu-tRNA(Gln) amidotransferase A subunit family amidase